MMLLDEDHFPNTAVEAIRMLDAGNMQGENTARFCQPPEAVYGPTLDGNRCGR